MGRLLSVSKDAKTVKGQAYGYLTGIMYLAPSTLSGRNLCPDASPGCIAACLNTAGRGAFTTTQQGRIKRSHFLRQDRAAFMAQLVQEIAALVRKAERMGLTPLVRLNGTSDIPWENIRDCGNLANIFAKFPMVQFYDYTKSAARMKRYLARQNTGAEMLFPRNYSLTFSRSECNESDAIDVLRQGGNISVVFSTKRGESLPARWNGFLVTDGDLSDARPTDPGAMDAHLAARQTLRGTRSLRCGYVIGLRAKGKARRDTSGFVVQV